MNLSILHRDIYVLWRSGQFYMSGVYCVWLQSKALDEASVIFTPPSILKQSAVGVSPDLNEAFSLPNNHNSGSYKSAATYGKGKGGKVRQLIYQWEPAAMSNGYIYYIQFKYIYPIGLSNMTELGILLCNMSDWDVF